MTITTLYFRQSQTQTGTGGVIFDMLDGALGGAGVYQTAKTNSSTYDGVLEAGFLYAEPSQYIKAGSTINHSVNVTNIVGDAEYRMRAERMDAAGTTTLESSAWFTYNTTGVKTFSNSFSVNIGPGDIYRIVVEVRMLSGHTQAEIGIATDDTFSYSEPDIGPLSVDIAVPAAPVTTTELPPILFTGSTGEVKATKTLFEGTLLPDYRVWINEYDSASVAVYDSQERNIGGFYNNATSYSERNQLGYRGDAWGYAENGSRVQAARLRFDPGSSGYAVFDEGYTTLDIGNGPSTIYMADGRHGSYLYSLKYDNAVDDRIYLNKYNKNAIEANKAFGTGTMTALLTKAEILNRTGSDQIFELAFTIRGPNSNEGFVCLENSGSLHVFHLDLSGVDKVISYFAFADDGLTSITSNQHTFSWDEANQGVWVKDKLYGVVLPSTVVDGEVNLTGISLNTYTDAPICQVHGAMAHGLEAIRRNRYDAFRFDGAAVSEDLAETLAQETSGTGTITFAAPSHSNGAGAGNTGEVRLNGNARLVSNNGTWMNFNGKSFIAKFCVRLDTLVDTEIFSVAGAEAANALRVWYDASVSSIKFEIGATDGLIYTETASGPSAGFYDYFFVWYNDATKEYGIQTNGSFNLNSAYSTIAAGHTIANPSGTPEVKFGDLANTNEMRLDEVFFVEYPAGSTASNQDLFYEGIDASLGVPRTIDDIDTYAQPQPGVDGPHIIGDTRWGIEATQLFGYTPKYLAGDGGYYVTLNRGHTLALPFTAFPSDFYPGRDQFGIDALFGSINTDHHLHNNPYNLNTNSSFFDARSLVTDPATNTLYMFMNDAGVLAFDATKLPFLEQKDSPAATTSAVVNYGVYDSSGPYIWGVGSSNLLRLDPSTLAITTFALSINPNGLALRNGFLWTGHEFGNTRVYRIDPADPTASPVVSGIVYENRGLGKSAINTKVLVLRNEMGVEAPYFEEISGRTSNDTFFYLNLPQGGQAADVAVPAASITTTDFAPDVDAGAAATVVAVTITTTDFAPTIQTGAWLRPPIAAVTTTDFAPDVDAGAAVPVGASSTTVAGLAPVIDAGVAAIVVSVELATITTTDFAPDVDAGAQATVVAASITTTDFAPDVDAGAQVSVVAASITTTDFAPDVDAGAQVPVTATSITTTDFAPDVDAGAQAAVVAAPITTTDFAPDVDAGAVVPVNTISISVTAIAPDVDSAVSIAVPALNITVAGVAPDVDAGAQIPIPAAAITTTDFAPTVTGASTAGVTVPAAAIATTELAPTVGTGEVVLVASINVPVQALAPQVPNSASLFPAAVAISTALFNPVLQVGAGVSVQLVNVTTTAYPPTLVSGVFMTVGVASVTVEALAPDADAGAAIKVPLSDINVVVYDPGVATVFGVHINVPVAEIDMRTWPIEGLTGIRSLEIAVPRETLEAHRISHVVNSVERDVDSLRMDISRVATVEKLGGDLPRQPKVVELRPVTFDITEVVTRIEVK